MSFDSAYFSSLHQIIEAQPSDVRFNIKQSKQRNSEFEELDEDCRVLTIVHEIPTKKMSIVWFKVTLKFEVRDPFEAVFGLLANSIGSFKNTVLKLNHEIHKLEREKLEQSLSLREIVVRQEKREKEILEKSLALLNEKKRKIKEMVDTAMQKERNKYASQVECRYSFISPRHWTQLPCELLAESFLLRL